MQAIKGPICELGEWHCDLQTAKQLLLEKELEIPLIGTFVRNPLDWYRSAWMYWKETERFPRPEDAPQIETDNFECFVRNCMAVEPQGYVSKLYEQFTGHIPGEISVIGKQENLVDDLIRLLKLAGENFDEEKLQTVKSKNVAGSKTDLTLPGYSYYLTQKVIQFEQRTFKRYGYIF